MNRTADAARSEEGAALRIRFWGTRGTVVPHVSSIFGIHTTCIEVQAGDALPLFVDFGTGAIPAAEHALKRGIRHFDFWLTHTHSDHINGMFAFSPFYRDDCTIRIFTAAPNVQEALERWFAPPYHPLSLKDVVARLEIVPLPAAGKRDFSRHGLSITWGGVPHPQPCSALRFEAKDSAFVFATDVEILADGTGGALRSLLAEPFPAGLAAIDGFFLDSEVHKFEDWGHSSWKEAWDLCQQAGTRVLLITHHHPALGDEQLSALEASTPENVVWAREGDSWTVYRNVAKRDT